MAHTIRHIADMHREEGRPASAHPLYVEALEIYSNDPTTLKLDFANALRGFGLLLSEQGDPAEAGKVRLRARTFYAELGIQAGVDEMS